ncbi:MAG TPA: prephenate dehydratase domain-containing protein [Terriglobales bacterium]|nr:prephenate dehydratase domain-containing protein [Terriglobales bacterium]
MRIAIQGIAGSFSEAACHALRPRARVVYCRDFNDLFRSLADHRAQQALVPVENTLAGEIAATRRLLARTPHRVVSEIRLRISLALIVRPDAELAHIRHVLSHPVALLQCRRFLARHPDWRARRFFDTAGSVKEIMRIHNPTRAALASPHAAAVYGAKVARRGVGDKRANFTKFLLIAPIAGRVLSK